MKNALKLLLVVAAGLLFFGSYCASEAASWKIVFIEEDGTELYIDTGSIIDIDENIVRVWEKTGTRKPSEKPSLYLIDVDCRYSTFRTLQSILPDDVSKQPAATEWQPLEKIGSFEARERLYGALCSSAK